MASSEYFEEAPQVDSFEDKSSLEMWKCGSGDAIKDSERNGAKDFDCNICLDCVQDPVITHCGHLYCWPCIYKWLKFHGVSSGYEEKEEAQCPVCKSEISKSSLTPLFGRGQTTSPSKSKAQQAGIVIPPRPLVTSRVADLPRSSASQPTSQAYHHHPHYPHYPQPFNSFSGSYTSPMLNTGQTAYGVFGEMIYARVFGNQVTNVYTYPNSYDLSGISSNPRLRRHFMQADKSLSRICFFLLCCTVLCLLSF